MKSKTKPFDTMLFIAILILLGFGVIMILSASSHLADLSYGSPYYFFIRQIIWAALGVAVMLFVSKIDYRIYKKFHVAIYVVSIVLLILPLIPGISSGEIRGAKRWINLGFMDFQPSEFAKLAIILFLSAKLADNHKKLKKFWGGFVLNYIWVGIICALLYLEPHYSALALIFIISTIIMFVAGAKIKHFLLCISAVLPLGIFGIFISNYRLERIFGFLDPWSDPTGSGWQVIKSLYAIGSGGIFGLGLGKSRQKYLYLPDAHNDFILAIVGEELGLIGMIGVMLLFLILIWRGIIIATKAKDMFASLVATGITMLVAIQILLNIAIVTGWFPVTGMPVPFLSYGGTSMLVFCTMMGILLNISRNTEKL